MKSYKITGIESIPYNGQRRFSGFILENVCGDVDVFVDDNFDIPGELKKLMSKDGGVEPKNIPQYIKAEMEWAEKQVGKTLTCDELYYRAFATRGKVTIK